MPYANYNATMRDYMLRRYYRRRADALALLGGRCVQCQSAERLEFDHVDPETKAFNVGAAFSGWAWPRITAELDKCQLLCKSCHDIKTLRA